MAIRKLYNFLISKIFIFSGYILIITLYLVLPGLLIVPITALLALFGNAVKIQPIFLLLIESLISITIMLLMYRKLLVGSVDFIGKYKYKVPSSFNSINCFCVNCGKKYDKQNEFCDECGRPTKFNKSIIIRENELNKNKIYLENIYLTIFVLVINYLIFGILFTALNLNNTGIKVEAIPSISNYLFIIMLAIFHLVIMSRLAKSVIAVPVLWAVSSLAGCYLLYSGFLKVLIYILRINLNSIGVYDVFSFICFILNIILLFFIISGFNSIKYIKSEEPDFLGKRAVRNQAKNPYYEKAKIKYCTFCGIKNDIDNHHCFNCGATDVINMDIENVTGKVCNACGNQLFDKNIFCRNCGKPVCQKEKDTGISAENFGKLKKAKVAFSGSVIIIFLGALINIFLGFLFFYLRSNYKALNINLNSDIYKIFTVQAVYELIIIGVIFLILGIFVMRKSLLALILSVGIIVWNNLEYLKYMMMTDYLKDIITGIQTRNIVYIVYFMISIIYIIPLLFGLRSIYYIKKYGYKK